MNLVFTNGRFEVRGFNGGKLPGFVADDETGELYSIDAQQMLAYLHYADNDTQLEIFKQVAELKAAIAQSRALESKIFVPCPRGKAYDPYQLAAIAYGIPKDVVWLCDEMGLGKAQPLTAKLLTPNGWKLMAEAKIGMPIMGRNGRVYNITGVYPQGDKKVYKVYFDDGTSTECCDEHLWAVRSPLQAWRNSTWKIKSLKDIRKKLVDKMGNKNSHIPVVESFKFPTRKLPIDPYLLGLLLGDGSINKKYCGFTSADKDVVAELEKLLPYGLKLSKKKKSKYDYLIAQKHKKGGNPLVAILQALQVNTLSHKKFIPGVYKFANHSQRLAIFQGLMDSDGTAYSNVDSISSTVSFCSTSKKLSRDVQFLVESFGGTASFSSKKENWYEYKGQRKLGKISYHLYITLPDGITPFRCKRKYKNWKPRKKYKPRRMIVKVEYAGIKSCQCISTSAPDRLYITDHCIVTHNTQEAIGIVNWDIARKRRKIPRGLVICQNHLKLHWMNHLGAWLIKEHGIDMVESDWFPSYAQWVILNYESLEKWEPQIKMMRWGWLIIDEFHNLCNPKANRTRQVYGNPNLGIDPIRAERTIMISGTPFNNRTKELFPSLHYADSERWPNFHEFGVKFCDAQQKKTGRWDYNGSSNLGELQAKLRSTLMIRRLKDDVLKDLPPKRRQVIEIPVGSTDLEWIKEAQEAFDSYEQTIEEAKKRAESAKVNNDDETYKEAMAQLRYTRSIQFKRMSAFRYKTAIAKLPFVMSHLADAMQDGRKIIVFGHHHDVLEKIYETYKDIALINYGGKYQKMSGTEAAELFQTDPKYQLYLCSIRKCEGLTLTEAHHEIFAELDWVPSKMKQAEDRAHRRGSKADHILIQIVTLAHSLDAKMAHKIVEKLEIMEATLDKGEEWIDPDPISVDDNADEVDMYEAQV